MLLGPFSVALGGPHTALLISHSDREEFVKRIVFQSESIDY